MKNTSKAKARMTKALVACWVGISLAVMAQQGLDLSAYKTDGSVDMDKVTANAGDINANQAVALTRQLVKEAPGLAQQITDLMSESFPGQAGQIQLAASGGLMDNIETQIAEGQNASSKETSQEQVLENKFEIATRIAFTSDNAALQRRVIDAAVRSEELGLGGAAAVTRGAAQLTAPQQQQVITRAVESGDTAFTTIIVGGANISDADVASSITAGITADSSQDLVNLAVSTATGTGDRATVNTVVSDLAGKNAGVTEAITALLEDANVNDINSVAEAVASIGDDDLTNTINTRITELATDEDAVSALREAISTVGTEDTVTAINNNFPDLEEEVVQSLGSLVEDMVDDGVPAEDIAREIIKPRLTAADDPDITSLKASLNELGEADRNEIVGAIVDEFAQVENEEVGNTEVLSLIIEYVRENDLEETVLGRAVEERINTLSDGFTF